MHQHGVEDVRAGGGSALSGGGALGPKAPITEEHRHRASEPVGVGHCFGCTGSRQLGRHARAVARIRPVQHRAVEPGRLERIVTALGDERSTDKSNPSEPVKQPELAHRIGKIDIRLIGDRLTSAASYDL